MHRLSLFECFTDFPERVGVVGMAKNAGKTVTLNHILSWCHERGQNVGVTSIGRDGEAEDVLTKTPKPAICLYEGMFFATGEVFLSDATLIFELLERTTVETAFGRICIGRVLSEGRLEISGGNTNSDHEHIMQRLKAHGASYILVDGAMDRQSLAAPPLLTACILSTGAVLSRDLAKVITMTKARVTQLTLPKADAWLCNAFESMSSKDVDEVWRIGVVRMQTKAIEWLHTGRIMLELSDVILKAMDEETHSIVFRGALTERMLAQIATYTKRRRIDIIIRDGTKLFLDASSMKGYMHHSMQFKVIHPIRLMAVTLNPTSPQGYRFDAKSFLTQMQAALGSVPVIDVCLDSHGAIEALTGKNQ